MVKELSITLNQDTANTYYVPGSTITGTLTIEVEEPKNYKQITIFLRGNGLVSWSEGSGEHQRSYRATETYANEQVVVWTKQDSPSGTFPYGRYTYPFQFTLPTNCPSSYQSAVGKITYMIEGVVSTGTLKFDHKVRHPIAVLELVSGNGPQTQEPVRFEKQKTVGCWFCKSGQITFNAEVERTGFNSGEELPLSFYVENGSGRQIKVRCELVETVHYYASGGHRRGVNRLASSIGEPINPHTTSGQQFIRLPIPNNLRPAITRSNIIKSVYSANVTLVIPWAINSTIELPVVIGNVTQQNVTSHFFGTSL